MIAFVVDDRTISDSLVRLVTASPSLSIISEKAYWEVIETH